MSASVQTSYVIAAISLFIDFKKCTNKTLRRQILYGKPDGVGGSRESLVLNGSRHGRRLRVENSLAAASVVEFDQCTVLPMEGRAVLMTRQYIRLSSIATKPVRSILSAFYVVDLAQRGLYGADLRGFTRAAGCERHQRRLLAGKCGSGL